MLGAFIGDSTGSYLEFLNPKEITEELVKKAMTMPGGGILRIGAGQVTDDGELTLTLWKAIHDKNPNEGFPITQIVKGYINWFESFPFDIGDTCYNAFELFQLKKDSLNFEIIEDCLKQIGIKNSKSEANGALMRATAIATWIGQNSDISPLVGVQFAIEDSLLSHPTLVCQETNAIYVFSIIHLLRGEMPEKVIELTNDFVNKYIESEKVKKWYFEDSQNISDMDCTVNKGHVRWGFTLAFYFLRNPQISFSDAIYTTLLHKGDTDTNACIVGGMVATYKKVPDEMLQKILTFDCVKEGIRRPIEYSIKEYIIINKKNE